MLERLSALRERPAVVECGIAVVAFTLALAIRLPYLVEIPRYTDEFNEVNWALDIASGKHFPLTAVDPYDGPLFSYLIASLVSIFGKSIALPRLMIAVFGALTVVAVYLLGRVARDRAAGIVGASFALTSPVLVILGSHHGWSSALTPFFISTTVLFLMMAFSSGRALWYSLTGLSGAFALQAHPTTAVALVGMGIWFLLHPAGLQRLKHWAAYFAPVFLLIGYLPMLIANVRTNSPLVQSAYERSYGFGPSLEPAEYLRRLLVELRFGGFFFGGGFGDPTLILRAQSIAMELALIASFVWAWRKKDRLIPITAAVGLGVLPVFIVGDSYRYYFFLLPMLYVLLSTFLVSLVRAFTVRPLRAIASGLVLGFILFPIFTIFNFYSEALAQGQSNAGYLELVRLVRTQDLCGPQLYVEDIALDVSKSEQVAKYLAVGNVGYVLTLDQCGYQKAGRTEMGLGERGGWLIAPAEDASLLDPNHAHMLESVSSVHFEATFVPLALYRIDPQQ